MCVKKSSSSLGGGVSPNTSSLPQDSWGGSGLLRSSGDRSSSLGAERRWPPGSAGKRQLRKPRPWGDPVQAAARMEETSSGAGATGDGLPPQLSSPTAWRGLLQGPASRGGLCLGPGSGSRGTRQARRGKRASWGRSQEPTAPRPLIVSPLPPGGKQEARRLAERRTGARTNERSRRRAWRQMSAGKRGGTSGRAVTLFPPFGLEAPPFVFPAQSIKIGKKKSPDRSGRVRRRFPHPLPPPPPSLLTMCKAAGSPA